jgi:UDP-N-acetylglucosamine 1-carboxyvinyltransferase
MTLRASTLTSTTAPYDIVRKMRASVLVLGPLVARMGEATVSLPGGCAIGLRPIDLHLKALEALGAELEITAGYVKAKAPPGGLRGGEIRFPIVSVGATENALMAAVLAKGTTVIENAAREPEITDLAKCLIAMGARIEGLRTDTLTIEGVPELHGATYSVMPDRIEAGSYACAAMITGGSLELVGARKEAMPSILSGLPMPARSSRYAGGVRSARTRHQAAFARHGAVPGFPDRHAGAVHVDAGAGRRHQPAHRDDLRERYMHVPELNRMGADIEVRGRSAVVRGVEQLHGAPVMATDLRASMSLVLAGLAAEGATEVNRVYHLDRGYERLEEKLQGVGADIERSGG